MSITAVPNSPIGWSDAHQSALQPKDSRYCQPWGVTPAGVEHDMRFQLQFSKVGYNLYPDYPQVLFTGNTTSVGSFQLIDSGANFTSPPIQAGTLAVNVDTEEQTYATGLGGTTAINTNDDIFDSGTSGDEYKVFNLILLGSVSYNFDNNNVDFAPNNTANTLVIDNFFPNTTDRFAVEIEIENYAGGELTLSTGSYPGSPTAFDSVFSAQGNGTFTFFGIPAGFDLFLLDSTGEANYTITAIRIYYAAKPEVFVYEESTEIDQIDPTEYIHNRALFTVDILSYGIGCYTLYANSVNGLVGSSTFPLQVNPPWLLNNIGPGWAFTAGELVHTVDGPVESDEARYNLQANADINCNYVIYFRLATGSDKPVVYIDLPSTGPLIVSTYFGSVLGDEYYINIYGYNFNDIRFVASETDSVTIEEFNLYKTFYNEPGGYFSPDLTEYVAAFRIAPNFCTIAADVCVKELGKNYVLYESSITNGEFTPVKKKNRWLPASESYTERCFVQSNVRYARTQDDDFESYRDSDGFGRVVFSDPVRLNECQIAPAPEWVHNWMAWAIRNTFKVNGEEYYPLDGNYSPNWQRDSPNASAVFEIAKQDQDIKTTGCD